MARSPRPVLSLALVAPLLASCALEPGAALTRRPIINGEVDESHPAVVALVALGSEFCSGTVIAPRAVLTAGHCVVDTGIDPSAIVVFFGTVVGGEGVFRRVTAAAAHPDFYVRTDGAPMYDVAVLTLAEDAPVAPVAWQRTPLEDPTGKRVTFVGYGVTNAQQQSGSGTRRVVDGVVTSMDDFFIMYGDGYSGTCQGDSGGPMLLDVDGTPTIIGVTSYGDRSCVALGGNTRVDPYADFIAPLAPVPVALTVNDPYDGAYLGQDFTVAVDAATPAGVAEVALLLDDAPVATLSEAPYSFDLTGIPDGDHILTLQATGRDGGHGVAEVWVTVVTQELGVFCRADGECRSGSCAEAGSGQGFCTQACQGDADCPARAACGTIDGTRQCLRPGTAAGGCAAGGRPTGAAAGLLVLGAAALAGGRARRRRRRGRAPRLVVAGLAPLLVVAGLAAALAACGDNRFVFATDAGRPAHQAPGPRDAAPPPLDSGAPSGIGEPCTAEDVIGPGTCAAGLLCLTESMSGGLATNGYCTLQCGDGLDCPWDATCVTVSGATGLCLRQCAQESDCRTADGFHCVEKPAGAVCWSWRVEPGTNDGGACTPLDAGPFVNAAGRVFGPSLELTAPDGGMLEAQTRVVAKGTTVAASFVSYSSSFGGGRMAVVASQNGGVTFGPAVVVHDTVTSRKSDPVLAVDPAGSRLYLAWVGYDRSGGTTTNMRVFVARSDDGGLTWPGANVVDATTTDSSTGAVARPAIATGPGDTVYVAYVLGTGPATAIKVARSSDHGATWDAPVRVDDGARTTSTRGLPQVATTAAGDVYVAWGEIGAGVPDGDAANDVFVARWAAGGAWGTFGANVKASADADLVVSNGLAVVPAPSGPKVYVVYAAGPPDAQRWDVRMTWSDDLAATFSAASIKLNDDATCAIHVLPTAAIDDQDRLHVTWYDNRFGADAGAYFYARWDPAAGTPGASELVSDGTFAYSTEARAPNRLGSYAGLAVDGTSIYATWTDPRGVTNTSHIRFASGTLP